MAISQGMLPLAPHLYFTQLLDDDQPDDRRMGMAMGREWLNEADEMWLVGPKVTEGMRQELEYARMKNIPVKMKKV